MDLNLTKLEHVVTVKRSFYYEALNFVWDRYDQQLFFVLIHTDFTPTVITLARHQYEKIEKNERPNL